MNIFTDGFQNTGKSTILDKCDLKHNRFSFNEYLDLFELKEQMNGFQIGKDLGILFALQYNKENIIFDRGPFSSIFYSLKENRFGDKTPEILTKFLSEISKFKNCRFIWVIKKNDKDKKERKHNDGFDYLDDDNDPQKDEILKVMVSEAKKFGITLHIFENDFSYSIDYNVDKFNKLLEELTNEYNRD